MCRRYRIGRQSGDAIYGGEDERYGIAPPSARSPAADGGSLAPYSQVVAPLRTGGQGVENPCDPENSPAEAKLVLSNGEPRLWIMHLPHVGLGFSRIARHRRVTQCLGSLGGKEWLIGVAPPGDPSDDARPRVNIVAFRIPRHRVVKLHVANWHAGPHFGHDECQFFNLENLDTYRRDFHAVPLPAEYGYVPVSRVLMTRRRHASGKAAQQPARPHG
jgi:hypothetical protein